MPQGAQLSQVVAFGKLPFLCSTCLLNSHELLYMNSLCLASRDMTCHVRTCCLHFLLPKAMVRELALSAMSTH